MIEELALADMSNPGRKKKAGKEMKKDFLH
jgi:hypothetical protein